MSRRSRAPGLADVIPARGAAFGDLFNDGKIDVVINPIDGPPVLLRNVNPDHHHWVEMKLVGGPKQPARRYLRHRLSEGQRHAPAPGRAGQRQLHFVQRPASPLRPGRRHRRGTAEIHWPSGARETIKLPAVDRIYTITEGQGITGALCGGKPCETPASEPAHAAASSHGAIPLNRMIDRPRYF